MSMVPWDSLFHTRSPLFWPIRPAAEAFAQFTEWPDVDDYNRALGEGFPVCFYRQPPKRRRRGRRVPLDTAALYDARIHLERRVPTRPRSWHDFLNMLVWAAFPRGKAMLHGRQHRAISARIEPGAETLPDRRTREQDGLAMLDEGGILLLCEERFTPAVNDALERRHPGGVRDVLASGHAAALLFGHALYETLIQGGPTIHAMAHVIPCAEPLSPDPGARVALADEGLGEALARDGSFSCPERFRSLPVDERILTV